MRYFGLALAGLLMTTSLAQAGLYDYQYSTDEIKARSAVPAATDADHPMVHHVDGLVKANRLGNNSDLRLFARDIGPDVSEEVRTQAQSLLTAVRTFSTQLRAGAMGQRIVDSVSEVDRLPLAWSALKWVAGEGETANRVAAVLERGTISLGHEQQEDDTVLLAPVDGQGAPTVVEPTATDAVTLKGAFALLAAAAQPATFRQDLAETQRFFWTTKPLPQRVLNLVDSTGFPFVLGEGADRKIGFPSAGFVFGARGVVHGDIADTSGFMNFPAWGTRAPLSTAMMEEVALVKQGLADWSAGSELSQQWAEFVDLVDLRDVQKGDWFIRRWEGASSRQGASGIVRAVESDDVGIQKLTVTEANRSDPDVPRGFAENGLEFDGQGNRGKPLNGGVESWLVVKVGAELREVTPYLFRLKAAAFAVEQAVVSGVSELVGAVAGLSVSDAVPTGSADASPRSTGEDAAAASGHEASDAAASADAEEVGSQTSEDDGAAVQPAAEAPEDAWASSAWDVGTPVAGVSNFDWGMSSTTTHADDDVASDDGALLGRADSQLVAEDDAAPAVATVTVEEVKAAIDEMLAFFDDAGQVQIADVMGFVYDQVRNDAVPGLTFDGLSALDLNLQTYVENKLREVQAAAAGARAEAPAVAAQPVVQDDEMASQGSQEGDVGDLGRSMSHPADEEVEEDIQSGDEQ